MNDYLLRHAIENVWCNPGQDRQFVYKLARLTPRYGVRNVISLFYEKITLPTQIDKYHIYQIGKVIPRNIGLPMNPRRWMSLAELAESNGLFSDLYITNGFQFPRFESFLWITPSRNVVVAVKINDRIAKLDDEDLYIRLYSNAYYESERSEGNRQILCGGMRVDTQSNLLAFQHEVQQKVQASTGVCFYYVNGRFVSNISLTTAIVGDVVEYIIDPSIKKMVEWPIASLPAFTSSLDAGQKYLLHYDDPTVDTIEYLDDVDIYLMRPGNAGRFMGVYYHKNEGDWLRMVTHKDYSIPSERLDGFVQTHVGDPRTDTNPSQFPSDEWTTTQSLVLRAYIRHSGYNRPLVPNSNRIQELYKLSSDQIVNAMVGLEATVPLWRAEVLEECPYVRFMSTPNREILPIAYNRPDATSEEKEAMMERVGEVYGYHAASVILSNTPTPVFTEQGLKYAEIAHDQRNGASVFEYSADGVLLGYYPHNRGQYHRVINDDAVQVETISGLAADRLNTKYGNSPVTIPYGYNHRVYVCSKWAGRPSMDWQDVTEDSNLEDYGYLDDTSDVKRWVWTMNPDQWYGAVRIDSRVLCQTIPLRKTMGQLRFNISSFETHDGVDEYQTMTLPFGQLDIWLNGRRLIENLDYIVHWPQIVISNREYLVEDDLQTVVYRGYSFCQKNMERLPVNEWGYVEYGVLSNDQYYNIHSNRLLQINIHGHFHTRDDIVFDEERNALMIDAERNGAPYVINTPPSVLMDVFASDRIARREDDNRDAMVSGYLSELIPPTTRQNSDFILEPYIVNSVFANKVLIEILEGRLNPAGLGEHYSEQDIRRWCSAYEWLLDYDICNTEYDKVRVRVYPHWFSEPVGVDLPLYLFYRRVLETYLRYPPDISVFVYINQ